jgi:hypothetical protein
MVDLKSSIANIIDSNYCENHPDFFFPAAEQSSGTWAETSMVAVCESAYGVIGLVASTNQPDPHILGR